MFIISFLIVCLEGCTQKQNDNEILKKGSVLFAKYGCFLCHSFDGSVIYGPPLNDFFLKDIKIIRQGQELTVVANRKYLKRAIAEPRYEEVAGYQNKAMPQTFLSKKDVDILVDYIIAVNKQNNVGN